MQTNTNTMLKTKECGVCGKRKGITSFWVRSDNGKARNTCKGCQRAQTRALKTRKAIA